MCIYVDESFFKVILSSKPSESLYVTIFPISAQFGNACSLKIVVLLAANSAFDQESVGRL